MINTPINFSENYSRYYDLLYKDKDYKAEADYITSLIRSFQSKAKSIVELGCGTGNHAAVLSVNRFRITGVEQSAEMVKLAKVKRIHGFTPLIGNIENFIVDKKFDAAISLFHVISYLTLNDSLIACFRSTYKHLKKHGIFIFDVWYTPAVYYQQPETRIKRIEDDVIEVTRLAEPAINYIENVVDVSFEILVRNKKSRISEVFLEKHKMRHFSIAEIDFLASLTGFKVLKTEEFLTANQPGKDTWSVCFVLQKK